MSQPITSEVRDESAPSGAPSDVDEQPPAPGGTRRVGVLGGAFAAYLLAAVVLWWNVWSSHPTSVTTCGCDDPSLFMWFLEWPAYALAHGHNLFYSTALFHPGGINMLSNTSVLGIGVPLAPITWIFGPVATLNVASTIGPALTALSMFWLLLRWVRWTPAAFVGGLVFGFSPFVVINLAAAHLMTAVLALVPLMVACLDELLVGQRRRAVPTGVLLGLLVAVQFFVGTETLAIVVLCGAVATVLLIGYAAAWYRDGLVVRARHAVRGLVAAGAVALVLLAYPVWFLLRGPAHLTGLVWPTITPGSGGATLANLWRVSYMSTQAVKVFAGYQGPALPQTEYLGAGIVAVLLIGCIAWHRDRRLWLFGALLVITVAMSIGVQSYWTPWRLATGIPLVQQIIPVRIIAVTTLCAAVMLAVVVDRAYRAASVWVTERGSKRWSSADPARLGLWTRVAAGGVAFGVAAVAVVPMGSALADNIPLTTQAVTLPPWFATTAPHLESGQVVLTFPPPGIGGSAMAWQAVDALHFAMATGTGPGNILGRAGAERAGQAVLAAGGGFLTTPAPPTARDIRSVRQALAGWGVTVIAVPEPRWVVAPYDQAGTTAWALGLFTAALGRAPQFRGDTWVWTEVTPLGPSASLSSESFARCADARLVESPAHQAVPACILAAPRQS